MLNASRRHVGLSFARVRRRSWSPQEAPSSESPAYSVNVLRLSAIRQPATFLRGQASHRRRRRRRRQDILILLSILQCSDATRTVKSVSSVQGRRCGSVACEMASYSGSSSSSKPKSSKLKPVLRKFTQSEKNSLDLNRPAIEQGLGLYASDYGTGSRSVHDVTFQSPRRGYHNRSTSGTSQFSTATAGSGHRAGSFVHPFQQTPRPYTPPLAPSYTGSLMGSEYSRDSPVFVEDEDQTRHYPPMRNVSSPSNNSTTLNVNTTQPSLRIQTKPTSSSRLVHGSSQTNIHSSLTDLSSDIISPADTMSPSSAIRSSMDRGYRIRSNSQVDTRSREESIREARRKFEEKELAKEQKAHLAEVKAIERQNLREAKQMEKGQRKSSFSDTITRSKRSKSDLTAQEKGDTFLGRDYNSVPVLSPPVTTEDNFGPPRRSRTGASTTKKKTQSAWTQFMLWLRTRFLRMSKSEK
jgi:hypothetical protein